jgi:hypothetical protein
VGYRSGEAHCFFRKKPSTWRRRLQHQQHHNKSRLEPPPKFQDSRTNRRLFVQKKGSTHHPESVKTVGGYRPPLSKASNVVMEYEEVPHTHKTHTSKQKIVVLPSFFFLFSLIYIKTKTSNHYFALKSFVLSQSLLLFVIAFNYLEWGVNC